MLTACRKARTVAFKYRGNQRLTSSIELCWVRHIAAPHQFLLLKCCQLKASATNRWLAEFETHPHTKCVLLKTRAKRVEALLHELKPQDNPQAYRALQYEIGNAYREITDIKFEEGRSFEKVNLH